MHLSSITMQKLLVSCLWFAFLSFPTAAKLDCEKTTCNLSEQFYNFSMKDMDAMVDNKRKILLDWSPKAGCTSAVVMFLEHLNAVFNVDYQSWHHDYRNAVYREQCGPIAACMYTNPDWFRFKIVRNPYDRAVSMYTFWMHRSDQPARENMTFAQLLTVLESLPYEDRQTRYFRHFADQSRPFERYLYTLQHLSHPQKSLTWNDSSSSFVPSPSSYHSPLLSTQQQHTTPIYHEIVKLEYHREVLNRINRQLGTNFALRPKSHKFRHYAVRHAKHNRLGFIGDKPWSQIFETLPQNYGCFYNEELKEQVKRLFAWDLMLYDYDYPFRDCDER